MARKTVSTWELHIEKGVVAIAFLVLAGSVTWFMLMGAPYKNDDVGPAELGNQLRQVAEEVAARIRTPTRDVPTKDKADTDVTEFTLHGVPDLLQPAGPLRPPPPPLVGAGESSGKRDNPLVKVVAPNHVDARPFRNVIDLPPRRDFDEVVSKEDAPEVGATLGAPGRPHAWVLCAGVIDLAAQEAEFRSAGYPPDKWDFTLYRVDVQRRQVLRTAAGDQVGPWEDVYPWTPYKQPPPLPELHAAPDGSAPASERTQLSAVATRLHQPAAQRVIARPALPRLQSGAGTGDQNVAAKEPPIPYLRKEPAGFFTPGAPNTPDPDMQKLARDWAGLAKSALDRAEFDVAYFYAEAAYWARGLNPADQDKYQKLLDDIDKKYAATGAKPPKRELRRRLPIVAYDIDVIPGASYQYRVRVVAINRLAGEPNVFARPEDARRILIEGEWSAPTATIDVLTDLYVFVNKVDAAKKAAAVDVFRRVGQSFEKKQYANLKPGDVIGRKEKIKGRDVDFSTGLIVVDLDLAYDYRPPGGAAAEPTQAVIYADASNPGVLREMIVAQDQINEINKQLQAGVTPGKQSVKRGGPR